MLALLVVISLALLTDYFGESPSSPLHSFQRGIAAVLSPLQSGASTVLSPVRDVAHYISSTINAQSQLAKYKRENGQLTKQVAGLNYEGIEYRQAARLLNLDQSYNLKTYRPVAASLIGADPTLWYDTITLDKGSSSGVRYRDPVVGPGGLVGDVTTVNSTTSVVSLITSPKFSVAAMIENEDGAKGLIQPKLGDPSILVLNDLPPSANVSSNQLVVTSGIEDPSDPTIQSFAPPGIPIGTVSSTNPQSSLLENYQEQVRPLANLQDLSLVQILTRPHAR